MKLLKKIQWKAVGKAIGAFILSLGRGDLLLRMRVDKALPYILYAFILGCISIWMSYKTEQTKSGNRKSKHSSAAKGGFQRAPLAAILRMP